MRSFIGLATLATLGCTSTPAIFSEPPVATYYSENPQEQVTDCIAHGNNVLPRERKDGGEDLVIATNAGVTLFAFTTLPQGDGTRTEFRVGLGGVRAPWRACLGRRVRSSEAQAVTD